MRHFILDLAVRGKLMPQNSKDESAAKLLTKIAAEKKKLVRAGKIKPSADLPPVTNDEIPFAIPSGWEWGRLGVIGNIYKGNSINAMVKAEKYTGIADGIPFIATKDVGYGWDELIYENGVSIPRNETKFKIAPANSVLICSEGGSAGKKCGLVKKNICFGGKLLANKLYGNIEPNYILSVYQTSRFREMFVDKMRGIIGGISILNFCSLIIPIPPLAEQKRIVAKVKELMACCDKLEAELSAAEDYRRRLARTLLVI